MKRTLLVDTNFSSAPIHDYLLRIGHEVYVCGGNPQDYLARRSRRYIQIDYSDADRLNALVDELGFDHVVPGCNDRSYQACVALHADRRFPGLDGPATTDTLNNKQAFRLFASRAGLPSPRLVQPGHAGHHRAVIVKPVDAYSGRGVTIVRSPDQRELEAAILKAETFSHSRRSVIEEYVDGQLYSHSAFITGGLIRHDFIVEEHGTANPFVVDTSRVVRDFPATVLERVRNCITRLARELKLVDGLVHTQFIRNGDDFWLIEITRRCPGDLYSQLIELSTGFPYAEAYTRPFLGETAEMLVHFPASSFILRHTISVTTESVFGALQFERPLQIEKLLPLALAGDTVKASPFGRIALLFARARSESEFAELFEATLARRLYHLQ